MKTLELPNYFGVSTRFLLIARALLAISIMIRCFERLSYLYSFSKELPNLYNNSLNVFDLTNYSIASGSLILASMLYIFTIISSLVFLVDKVFHKSNLFFLFLLLTISTLDGVYIGKGLRIIWPYLLFFFCLPRVPLTRSNIISNVKNYNPLINLSIFVFAAGIYFLAFFFKTDPVWTESRTALLYFLLSDQWSLPLGKSLTHYPELLKFLTASTLILEATALSLLMFVLFKSKQIGAAAKNVLAISFIMFHFAIGITSVLTVFSLAMISFWFLFLDTNPKAQVNHFKITLLEKSLIGFLFLSLFTWNYFPKHLDRIPIVSLEREIAEVLRSFTIRQHWGLVAPAPGLHNYEVLIYKSTPPREPHFLFSSKKMPQGKYFADAFFTSAYLDQSLLNGFLPKYCKRDDEILEFHYHKRKIDIINKKNRPFKVFKFTKKCSDYVKSL